jgi:putative hydrolase of the HAD superfamily
MIKAIFFDLCGVIITLGDEEFCTELSQKIGRKTDEVLRVFYKYLKGNETGEYDEDALYKNMYKDLGVSYDLEKTKAMRTKYRLRMPGMFELVNELRKNYTIGYISNDAKEMAGRCNAKYDLESLFTPGMGVLAYQAGARKDNPKLWTYVLAKVNLKPEECVFLDDKEKNLTEAEKAGFHTIHFKNKKQLIRELKKLGIII